MFLAHFLCVLAAIMWGSGFIAQKYALEGFGACFSSTLRFLLAALFLFPLLKKEDIKRENIRLALMPAVLLSLCVVLQTYGLKFTTVSNAGFITVLYVVIVPFLESALKRRAPTIRLFIILFVAIIGTRLLTGADLGGWNRGDLFVLGCAFCVAFHLYVMGNLAPKTKSFMALSIFQLFWCAILLIPVSFVFEPFPLNAGKDAWLSVLLLAVFSTGAGFTIQIYVQKILAPTVFGLIALLEGPIAAICGYWLLGEQMSPSQWLGASLVISAAAGAIINSNRLLRVRS